MAKNDKRVKITLECTECKRRNYITMKSKINDRERLEMKKYCSHERRHTVAQGDPLTASRPDRCAGPRWYAGRPSPPRAVAQLVEHRSPKPTVGGSSPSCPAHNAPTKSTSSMSLDDLNREQKRTLKRMGALDEQGSPRARPHGPAKQASASARRSTSARSATRCARSPGRPGRGRAATRSSCSITRHRLHRLRRRPRLRCSASLSGWLYG